MEFFPSAKNKSSAALKARDIAVAKESAHAVDAYSSSSESVGSSGAVSGVKVQTIDEYIASNVSYSSKAQKDALKAKIDEAWSKYNESLDAGDGKESILKEIAFGLQKEFDDKYSRPFAV